MDAARILSFDTCPRPLQPRMRHCRPQGQSWRMEIRSDPPNSQATRNSGMSWTLVLHPNDERRRFQYGRRSDTAGFTRVRVLRKRCLGKKLFETDAKSLQCCDEQYLNRRLIARGLDVDDVDSGAQPQLKRIICSFCSENHFPFRILSLSHCGRLQAPLT